MDAPTRRAFLNVVRNAAAAATVGAIGVGIIEAVEAMPIVPDSGQSAKLPAPLTQAQWGPPPRPGRPPRPGWRPPPRRRRWVCWWHRGRRRCGWRWH